MFGTGFLAKGRAVRSATKVAVAATAATLTLTAAVAAAVVLPAGGGSGSAVVHSASVGASPAAPTTPTTVAASVGGEGDVSSDAPTGPAPATAGATGSAALATPPLPLGSLPIPSLPGGGGLAELPGVGDLTALTNIPTQVMACLAPVFELVSSLPATPSPTQVAQIGPSIVGCVTEIVEGLPLPFGMNACIAEIMGFVRTMTSQPPTGAPDIGELNVAACIPSGLPVPTGMSGFTGAGFPFGR